MIEPERLTELNDAPEQPGDYVLYRMQNSQRTEFNPRRLTGEDPERRSRAALELFEATPDVIGAGGQIHARAVLPVKRTIPDSDGHSNKSQ